MTLLEDETIESCASLVADTVPLVMQTIRAEMRRHRGSDLSVPQFRTLTFLRRCPGASLSAVAEHVGLTPPSTSKMIDRLEKQGLLARYKKPGDRRRIALKLTPQGLSTLDTAASATRQRLAEQLAALSPEARHQISEAMHNLRQVFGGDQTSRTDA